MTKRINRPKKTTAIDMQGEVVGRLTVVAFAGHRDKCRVWECSCSCGGSNIVKTTLLRRGITTSCGCLQREAAKTSIEIRTKHGHMRGGKATPEYRAWISAKTRCSNPRDPGWKDYGGRGIAVCDRWKNSFEAFIADMGPRPSKSHSLERNDVNGNYSPENCCWALAMKQSSNRRSVVIVELYGEKMSLAQATRRYGEVSYETARGRHRKGWNIVDAIMTPVRERCGNHHGTSRELFSTAGAVLALPG